MPELISKNEKQLNTKAANNSRFVTKVRWVVEVINTFSKNSLKAIKHVPNKSLPHTEHDYKIAGALINRYFKRLIADKDDSELILQNMKAKINVENELKCIVEADKLHLKSRFVSLSADEVLDFPKVDLSVIKTRITLGI